MPIRIDSQCLHKIRLDYLAGKPHFANLAASIGVSRKTIRVFYNECRIIREVYPEKLQDLDFWLPRVLPPKHPSVRLQEMIFSLPGIIDSATSNKLNLVQLWRHYKELHPQGFCLHKFEQQFIAWRRANNICLFSHRRVRCISDTDMIILDKWKRAGDHTNWERAVAILGSYHRRTLPEMMLQLERPEFTILKWIENYKSKGIEGLANKAYTLNDDRKAYIRTKQENITRILHQSPQIHGFNRTSWRMEDMAEVYEKVFDEKISAENIGEHLRSLGFGFKKSRDVLTSPDPKFREKLDYIKNILANLKPDEKFFSVDEYGHFSVKLKGGWTMQNAGIRKTVPQLQKSKGALLVTAALELSTNQVTHFYSKEKNTGEMIKLTELLVKNYPNETTLYISWDAATWHNSNKLRAHLAMLNERVHVPKVVLAPLPSSAQFLNVIESVFSGLAKAVIHNSDYPDLDTCMYAIDRHFRERNEYFQKNPRRAGKKIWGKENVKPEFSELNNCKNVNRSTKI